MRGKILVVLMVSAFVLAISGPAQAFLLPTAPYVQKTWNYEQGTFYAGGDQTAGSESTFYFNTAATSYHTEEYGYIDKDTLPGGGVYGGVIGANLADLFVQQPTGAMGDEDSWGLLRISEYRVGNITGDFRFGNNTITPTVGPAYWNEGDVINGSETYLRGMMWGAHDAVIEVIADGQYKIWSEGGQFSIWEVLDDPGYDPALGGNPDPTMRASVDEFPGWFNPATDELMAGGVFDYFRFQGDLLNPPGTVDGTTDILVSFTSGAWLDSGFFVDYWTTPGGTPSDMWQTWNIGDPFVFSNGWTGSEDSGRGFYIGVPEPVTMLGVLLGVSSLGGYLRRRRQESLT